MREVVWAEEAANPRGWEVIRNVARKENVGIDKVDVGVMGSRDQSTTEGIRRLFHRAEGRSSQAQPDRY